MPRLAPLTSLRFFAAAAIVLFHMGGVGMLPFGHQPALANGVSLFFVLSGFILTYNYPDMSGGVGRFYLARFARLWPVHAATLLLVMFMLPQLGLWATDRERGGDALFWSNLLLLQAWIPSGAYVLSFNGVSWSISVEMFFYAVFPLALLATRLWLVAAVAFAATLTVVIYAQFFAGISHQGDPWVWTWHHIALHFPPMRLFEFLAGMATARLFMRRSTPTRDTTGLEIGCLLLTACSVAIMQNIGTGLMAKWLGQCGSFLAFAGMVYIFAVGQGSISRMLCHPALVRLGEISFATYMVHQIVIRHAVNSKMTEWWNVPATVAALIVAIYAASYVLWTMVEVPARLRILALVRGGSSRPASSPRERQRPVPTPSGAGNGSR